MSYYAILFDLDGTLVDSLSDICGSLNRVRAELGLATRPQSELVRFIGKGMENLLAQAIPEAPAARRAELLDRYRAFYRQYPSDGGRIYPGVREGLETLRRRGDFRLGIVTNKPTDLAVLTVEHYLPGFAFDAIRGPDSVSRKKPAPEHLLETLAALDVPPARAWFVGDDPVDAACAAAAGVTFFGASYGFGLVREEKVPLIGSFREILAKLPSNAV